MSETTNLPATTTPTAPQASKRTIAALALSNFRHSWKDAFAGMKLRYFLIPNSKKIDPRRISWTQMKSITSILGGAVIGGGIGFAAYVVPNVLLSAFYTGAPLLVLGTGIRAIGTLMPAGTLKKSVNSIGTKIFAAGVVCAMWPMVAIGAVGFGAIHAVLTTGETLVKGFGVSLKAAYLTVRGRDAATATQAPAAVPRNETPGPGFAATAPKVGHDFSQAAADTAQTPQQPATTPAAKPPERKPGQ